MHGLVERKSYCSGASGSNQGQRLMQKQSRAIADRKRKEEKKRNEKKRKGGKKKWRKRKQRKDRKVLHLKVIVFWQAKTYGQAAHDVHSNSVHLVHESQHSFSAHAMQDYLKLQV